MMEEYASDRCITGSTPHYILLYFFGIDLSSYFDTQFVENVY